MVIAQQRGVSPSITEDIAVRSDGYDGGDSWDRIAGRLLWSF